jgi:hypothetical protein
MSGAELNANVSSMQSCITQTSTFERHQDMVNSQVLIAGLSPEAATELFVAMDATAIAAWAEDVNAVGAGGAQGLNADEKSDLFNLVASKVGGTQAARVLQAFGDDPNDVETFSHAVATHASKDDKLKFIAALAPATTQPDAHVAAGLTVRLGYDKDALAVAQVLGSLGKSGAGQAVASLDDVQLKAVITAAVDLRCGPPSSETAGAVSANPDLLVVVLGAVRGSGDAAAKARVFAQGAEVLQDLRPTKHWTGTRLDARLTAVEAKAVSDELTQLLNSDVRGVVHELGSRYPTAGDSAPLVRYLTMQFERNPDQATQLARGQLGQLMGEGTGLKPIDHLNQRLDTPAGPVYPHALDAGTYLGSMSAATARVTADENGRTAAATNALSTAIIALHAWLGKGMPVPVRVLTVGSATTTREDLMHDNLRETDLLRSAAFAIEHIARDDASTDDIDILDTPAGVAMQSQANAVAEFSK